jgi:signal transduction histidine kinase
LDNTPLNYQVVTQVSRGRLEITDDGVGIPEPELERLRQPFQRGLGVQHLPGSGLGLTLVNAVMESHNGRLELSQAEQGGLRGILEIPKMR